MIIEEVQVAESRAQQLDLAARVPFTEPGDTITETRRMLVDLYREPDDITPEVMTKAITDSARSLAALAGDDVLGVEWG